MSFCLSCILFFFYFFFFYQLWCRVEMSPLLSFLWFFFLLLVSLPSLLPCSSALSSSIFLFFFTILFSFPFFLFKYWFGDDDTVKKIINVRMCVCLCVRQCVCAFLCVSICVYVSVSLSASVYLRVCLYVCVFECVNVSVWWFCVYMYVAKKLRFTKEIRFVKK